MARVRQVAAAPAPTRVAPNFESGTLSNFSGGPNFRDSPSELAASETYGSWNITYDERGGASSRLGYTKRNSSVLGNGTSDLIVNDFYSDLLNVFLTQSGKKLYRADNTTSVHTFTTNGCVTFAEMNGLVIAAHPVDGMFSSTDGTTWTAFGGAKTISGAADNGSGLIRITCTAHELVTGDTVTIAGVGGTSEANGTWTVTVVTAGTFDLQGSVFTNVYTSGGTATNTSVPTAVTCCVVWQGRLYAATSDGILHWSGLGEPRQWHPDDFNAIWTKDQQPIVALCVGSGQDIQGRPGLIVFKQDSVYRVNNAATGAYTVISTTEGAAGAKAVVGVGSRVCWIGKRGVFWWREDQAGPVSASDQLQPVWQSSQLALGTQSSWCAGRRMNRALFSCSTYGSTVNNLAFELHPDEGWIAPRSDAVTCYVTSVDVNEATYGGSPTAPGQVYKLNSGGNDDGTAISWWLQTRWLVPNGGFQAFLWQLRAHGRGSGTMTVRQDYESAGGTSYPFNLDTATGSTYDSGRLYDDGILYATVVFQATQAFYDLATCRQFSLYFSGSSSTTVPGRTLFGGADAPDVGPFGLFSLEYLYVPLGLS